MCSRMKRAWLSIVIALISSVIFAFQVTAKDGSLGPTSTGSMTITLIVTPQAIVKEVKRPNPTALSSLSTQESTQCVHALAFEAVRVQNSSESQSLKINGNILPPNESQALHRDDAICQGNNRLTVSHHGDSTQPVTVLIKPV